jgi:hypothetical protein
MLSMSVCDGHYNIVCRMDDWNRHDEQWTMDCPTCRGEHGVYTTFATRDGMVATRYVWVPRAALQDLQDARDRIAAIKLDFSKYLETHHGAAWTAHFDGKTRAVVWRELTNDGREYPSLSTFSAQVRQPGLDQALKDYLQYDAVDTVIRILQLNDPELSAQKGAISDLEQVRANKEMHILSRVAFR